MTEDLRTTANYIQVSEIKKSLICIHYETINIYPTFTKTLNRIENVFALADLLKKSYPSLKNFVELSDIVLLKILDDLNEVD